MDAYELVKQGKLILTKTRVRCDLGFTYRVMRFETFMGTLRMFIELPDGDHLPVGTYEIRKMKLTIVFPKGKHEEEWVDPP